MAIEERERKRGREVDQLVDLIYSIYPMNAALSELHVCNSVQHTLFFLYLIFNHLIHISFMFSQRSFYLSVTIKVYARKKDISRLNVERSFIAMSL